LSLFSYFVFTMESTQSEPESIELMIVCEKCKGLSENIISCSICGSSILDIPNSENVSVSVSPDDKNEDANQMLSPNLGRKREVNCLGMYLSERKKEVTKNNSSRKLNMEDELKAWDALGPEDKNKYKRMSAEDRLKLKEKAAEVKSEEEIKSDIEKKRAKNVKDAVAKNKKRKQMNDKMDDIEASRTMIHNMIEEKKKTLEDIENNMIILEKEFTDLSGQVMLTGSLINVKKEALDKLKKDYKDLYSKHKNVKN